MEKYRSNAFVDPSWIGLLEHKRYKFTIATCLRFLSFFIFQGKFLVKPSVFVTAEHHHSGLRRDAASVWVEDVAKSSFKVCLRELENYAGSHEDLFVVSVSYTSFVTVILSRFAVVYFLLRDFQNM